MQPSIVARDQIEPIEARHPAADIGAGRGRGLAVEVEAIVEVEIVIPRPAPGPDLSRYRQHAVILAHHVPERNFRFAADQGAGFSDPERAGWS